MISCLGAGHIVLRTSVEGEEKPFPVWEAAFLFVPVRFCARMAVFAVRAERCAVGWGRGFQWAEEAGGAAGLPDSLSFRRLIGRAPLFVWVFFRKRERFALPEWNLFCGFSVLVAGDQAI